MRIAVLIGLFVLAAFPCMSQEGIGSIQYIQDLAVKPEATNADAVKMFVLQTGGTYSAFADGVTFLVGKGILSEGDSLEEADLLTRGVAAGMTVRLLNINDSLLYAITGADRYAYTTCVSEKLMIEGMSTGDILSGAELLDLTGKISSRTEEPENE